MENRPNVVKNDMKRLPMSLASLIRSRLVGSILRPAVFDGGPGRELAHHLFGEGLSLEAVAPVGDEYGRYLPLGRQQRLRSGQGCYDGHLGALPLAVPAIDKRP